MKPARTWPDGRREVVKRFFRDAIPKIELKVAPITDPESMRRHLLSLVLTVTLDEYDGVVGRADDRLRP